VQVAWEDRVLVVITAAILFSVLSLPSEAVAVVEPLVPMQQVESAPTVVAVAVRLGIRDPHLQLREME
jgi:hypothetical protein